MRYRLADSSTDPVTIGVVLGSRRGLRCPEHPVHPRQEPAIEPDPAGVPPRQGEQVPRITSSGFDPRRGEHEVAVHEHDGEPGDPGQEADQQPQADGELAEGDQGREQAGQRVDDVLEEPGVPGRRVLARDRALDEPLDRRRPRTATCRW